MQKVVPVFVRWMDLGVVIHDLADECMAVGGVSSCVTGCKVMNVCLVNPVSFALFISYLNHNVVYFDDFKWANPIKVG